MTSLALSGLASVVAVLMESNDTLLKNLSFGNAILGWARPWIALESGHG